MIKKFVKKLNTNNDKLISLRKIIKGYDAFLIPTSDQHCSADISRRKFMSGFTGSAGDAIITQDNAYMFVDSRYELQAEKELDLNNWKIVKTRLEGGNSLDWCLKNLKSGSVVGFDPNLIPASQIYIYQEKFNKKNISLRPYPRGNPVDFLMVGSSLDMMKLKDEIRDVKHDELSLEAIQELLNEENKIDFDEEEHLDSNIHSSTPSTTSSTTPSTTDTDTISTPPPKFYSPSAITSTVKSFAKSRANKIPPVLKKLRILPPEISGKSTKKKIEEINQKMHEFQADFLVLSVLDEIMWLFNIRASDISYNQNTPCYCIVSNDKSYLFIDDLSDTIRNYLIEHKNVSILPYSSIHTFKYTEQNRPVIWIDFSSLNYKIYENIKQNHPGCRIIDLPSPVKFMKAIKNEGELKGMRDAHVLDAIALIEFISWLEKNVIEESKNNIEENLEENSNSSEDITNSNKLGKISEVSLGEKLLEFRKMNEDFIQPSFPTIAGVNENGAIVHYNADEKSDRPFTINDILLLDSGGQYLQGTTDITRTLHFGTPTEEQKKVYTLVLKSFLALSSQKFPVNTTGYQLDVLARATLWNEGMNYGHGTGHGVGAALSVHEGPVSFSFPSGPSQRTPYTPSLINRFSSNTITNESKDSSSNSNSNAETPTPLPPYFPSSFPPGVFLPGMVMSIEPGSYLEKEKGFGVRIENLFEVAKSEEFEDFLEFKTLTLVPFSKNLINLDILTNKEIELVDNYHQDVYNKMYPLLKSEEAKEWLKINTKPLLEN